MEEEEAEGAIITAIAVSSNDRGMGQARKTVSCMSSADTTPTHRSRPRRL